MAGETGANGDVRMTGETVDDEVTVRSHRVHANNALQHLAGDRGIAEEPASSFDHPRRFGGAGGALDLVRVGDFAAEVVGVFEARLSEDREPIESESGSVRHEYRQPVRAESLRFCYLHPPE